MEVMGADKNSRKLFEAAENLEPVLCPSSCHITQIVPFKVYSILRNIIAHQFLLLLFPTDFYI